MQKSCEIGGTGVDQFQIKWSTNLEFMPSRKHFGFNLRMSSAMARCVLFSNFSNFLDTSLLRSQSGLRGARDAKSTSSMIGAGFPESNWSFTWSETESQRVTHG